MSLNSNGSPNNHGHAKWSMIEKPNLWRCDVSRATTWNPQANAIVEWVHQSIWNNMVCTWFANNPNLDKADLYNGLLTTVAFVTRATIHITLDTSPSQLLFGWDAILNMYCGFYCLVLPYLIVSEMIRVVVTTLNSVLLLQALILHT